MHCCLWFRSVFRVRGPLKRYGYHLSIIIIIIIKSNNMNNNYDNNDNNNSNNNNKSINNKKFYNSHSLLLRDLRTQVSPLLLLVPPIPSFLPQHCGLKWSRAVSRSPRNLGTRHRRTTLPNTTAAGRTAMSAVGRYRAPLWLT